MNISNSTDAKVEMKYTTTLYEEAYSPKDTNSERLLQDFSRIKTSDVSIEDISDVLANGETDVFSNVITCNKDDSSKEYHVHQGNLGVIVKPFKLYLGLNDPKTMRIDNLGIQIIGKYEGNDPSAGKLMAMCAAEKVLDLYKNKFSLDVQLNNNVLNVKADKKDDFEGNGPSSSATSA